MHKAHLSYKVEGKTHILIKRSRERLRAGSGAGRPGHSMILQSLGRVPAVAVDDRGAERGHPV